MATAVFFARADLVYLMMPERASAYRSDTLGLLIWTFVPVSATYIFSTLLTAGGQLGRMNRFFAVGIALDVLLNLWLVPPFQALGAAAAALITQLFIAAAMAWLSVRQFHYRPNPKSVAQIAGFALFLWAAHWVVFEKMDLPWPWKSGLGLLAGLAGLFLFQLIDLKNARGAFQR